MSDDEIASRITIALILLMAAGAVALGATWPFFIGWATSWIVLSLYRYHRAEMRRR